MVPLQVIRFVLEGHRHRKIKITVCGTVQCVLGSSTGIKAEQVYVRPIISMKTLYRLLKWCESFYMIHYHTVPRGGI